MYTKWCCVWPSIYFSRALNTFVLIIALLQIYVQCNSEYLHYYHYRNLSTSVLCNFTCRKHIFPFSCRVYKDIFLLTFCRFYSESKMTFSKYESIYLQDFSTFEHLLGAGILILAGKPFIPFYSKITLHALPSGTILFILPSFYSPASKQKSKLMTFFDTVSSFLVSDFRLERIGFFITLFEF